MQRFRVLIAGPAEQWVRSMKTAFQEKVYFAVVEDDESQELVDQINLTQPEVVLLLIDNDADNGKLHYLLQQCPRMNLILVVDDPNQCDLLGWVQRGACACLPARLLPRQIIHAVELIIIGGILCLPRLSQDHFKRLQGNAVSMPDNLTVREQEVLALIYQNLSNKEIAASLCLAESTVKTHLYNIFKKMGVRGRGEVLVTALKDRQINSYGQL